MALSTLKRGDDWKFTGTVLNPQTQLPQDITGGTVWLTMKTTLADTDVASAFQAKMSSIPATDVNGTDAVNGVVVLVAAWDTAGSAPPANSMMAAASYFYDFQYMDPNGVITTIAEGKVTVSEQVTEATVA